VLHYRIKIFSKVDKEIVYEYDSLRFNKKMVPKTGFEPAQAHAHWFLNVETTTVKAREGYQELIILSNKMIILSILGVQMKR
jgi:hypothetical protein